ncbi:MAG: hypothetical protein KC964_15625 [Candidatus Omnitrophica bacterium]|nr:hypothetical protein [Candidatus Omnitrophota bacterium]
MNPWLFDPRPMIEWKHPLGSSRGELNGSQQLTSIPSAQPESSRFPSDTIIHYRAYRDSQSRDSKVAFLEYGPKPRMCSELVDRCWINGVPLIVWFQEPPDWEAAYWKETLSSRSIHTHDTGRLRWQPIVSWNCDNLESAIDDLADWLNRGLPVFPLPILRFEFAEGIPFEGIGETLLEIAENPLPCRFKLFALSKAHRERLSNEQWAEILEGFQESPPTVDVGNQVISLYPEK